MRTVFSAYMRILLAIAGSALMSISTANAGEVSGKIKQLTSRASDNLHVVIMDAPIQGAPPCATHTYLVIRDENSTGGKSQFAMLMSAYLSGTSVQIVGSGTCTRWPDGEDILTVSYTG